jgi:hypothetical protein
MARGHAAQPNSQPTSRFQQDYDHNGVIYGKGGEPIPVNPVRGIPSLTPHAALAADPVTAVVGTDIPDPVALVKPTFEFYCDKTTWHRNMDGYQMMHVLNAMMQKMFGQELSLVLSEDEARQLPADCRLQFRRRAAVPKSWDDPDPDGDA